MVARSRGRSVAWQGSGNLNGRRVSGREAWRDRGGNSGRSQFRWDSLPVKALKQAVNLMGLDEDAVDAGLMSDSRLISGRIVYDPGMFSSIAEPLQPTSPNCGGCRCGGGVIPPDAIKVLKGQALC